MTDPALPFEAAIDEAITADDVVALGHARQVYADWLSEQGEEWLADAQRCLAEHGRWPRIDLAQWPIPDDPDDPIQYWTWWHADRDGTQTVNTIPPEVEGHRNTYGLPYSGLAFHIANPYPSRPAAERAFATALRRVRAVRPATTLTSGT